MFFFIDFETNSGLDTSTVRIHTRPPPERIGTWSRHTWQANNGGKVGKCSLYLIRDAFDNEYLILLTIFRNFKLDLSLKRPEKDS